MRWIFQCSRENWATSPGLNGPREIHPRDWSYGLTGGTLCQNTSEATGVERVSCVGEWGQPDRRLHSWTFFALWLIFHPMMRALTYLSKKICKWMCDLVSRHGHRCVPLIFMDGNAHLEWLQFPSQSGPQEGVSASACSSLLSQAVCAPH